ncbi:MAG: protein kinase, partial [Deltaproteobacteria bacterium]|nr:protein kinase [Deltaproteobacteria bacterium]
MSERSRIGDYELLDRIAEGGMAEVWRARARGAAGFEKTVVVKRVLPALAARPGFADLLIREAKIAARLSHPNIVQIFDLGESDGTYFIAMEYVHGTDLARALTHRGSAEHLPLALRVWILAEATRALDHAHRRKGDDGRPLHIVHRDVSPQNVLLAHEGVVKVADFGIARADEVGLGRGEDPKVLRGKYAYMSPEQARGEPLDRRSDVFALGVVLFEAITGQRLFRAKSSHETLQLVRAGKVPALSAAGVPDELVSTLTRALSPTKEDRHTWAGEIHAELMGFLYRRGEPVGEAELASAMERMFPAEEHLTPNKLRVDVMLRAYDDATGLSAPGGEFPETTPPADLRTQSLPIARRARLEQRRVAIVLVAQRAENESIFAEVVEANGGTLLASSDGAFRAAFGQLAGVERAPVHAVRAALDLRHRLRALGAAPEGAAIVVGECRVSEGVLLEPDEMLSRVAADAFRDTRKDITVPTSLAPEVDRVFAIEPHPSQHDVLVVTGYRRRTDRDLSTQRAAGPLVGRRAELDALRAAVEACQSAPHLPVHLSGVPGVGKTRLLAELRAALDGVAWAVGRADESDLVHDHGILADLVRDLCGIEHDDTPAERHGRVDRLKVLGLSASEVRTLGETIGLAYPLAPIEREGRARSIDVMVAIRKAVLALSRDWPVVVVLEDLHFADDASLQVLPLLLRGLEHRGVLCITSRRAGAIVPVLPGKVTVLAPLDVEATGKVLAGGVRARASVASVSRWAHEETGGVPEWIELLARVAPANAIETMDGEITAARFEATLDTPARQKVAAWLDPLRRVERHVLLLVALCPGAVATPVVLAAAEEEGDAAERAVHRLMARGWIVDPLRAATTGVADERTVGRWGGTHNELPARVAVASRMIARAVETLVDLPERSRAHQRLLTVLEARP